MYRFKAITSGGEVVKGKLDAKNEFELDRLLLTKGMELLNCKKTGEGFSNPLGQKLTKDERLGFVIELEQLLKSGIPLLDALHSLRDTAKRKYYAGLLAGLIDSIESGQQFSSSLRLYNQDFDDAFIALIVVGEESGNLAQVLAQMADSMKWLDDIISSTVKIMIYPAIVSLVILAVTSFLMIYLVPKIIPFILDMGTEIPLHTAILIDVSSIFINYWWLVIPGPFIFVISLKVLASKVRKIDYVLDRMKFKVPIFGPIYFGTKIATLSNYMALLYSSGISFIKILEICRPVVNSSLLSDALEDVHRYVSDGTSIGDSFDRTGLFPPLVIRLIRVGENTGRLDESLLNISYFFNREIQKSISRVEPAITPILTVLMGFLIGWIMLSVLGPVWDAVGSIGL